jgi:hypothetical protein
VELTGRGQAANTRIHVMHRIMLMVLLAAPILVPACGESAEVSGVSEQSAKVCRLYRQYAEDDSKISRSAKYDRYFEIYQLSLDGDDTALAQAAREVYTAFGPVPPDPPSIAAVQPFATADARLEDLCEERGFPIRYDEPRYTP